MWRYFRLYGYFVRFSVSRALEFRLDFFFRIIMDVIYYTVNLAFFKILFLHTPSLAGWTESETMLFVSGFLLLDAVQMTLFSNNMYLLPLLINKGDLDYYLLRPVSSLFFLSLRDFAANSFINLLMTFGILGWAISQYPGHFGILRTIAFLFLLGVGTFIFYSLRMITIIATFWTHSPRGHDSIFWPLTRVMERPDRIFHGWFRVLFTTILPFSLMASFPARIIIGPFEWNILLQLIAVAAAFYFITLKLWNKGLRIYSSASS
jgi:viologen exporter family transport system permease protein